MCLCCLCAYCFLLKAIDWLYSWLTNTHSIYTHMEYILSNKVLLPYLGWPPKAYVLAKERWSNESTTWMKHAVEWNNEVGLQLWPTFVCHCFMEKCFKTQVLLNVRCLTHVLSPVWISWGERSAELVHLFDAFMWGRWSECCTNHCIWTKSKSWSEFSQNHIIMV